MIRGRCLIDVVLTIGWPVVRAAAAGLIRTVGATATVTHQSQT